MQSKDYFLKNIYLKVAQKDDSSDNLVGIRIDKEEKLTVIFPIGYNIKNKALSEKIPYNEEYKEDVKLLIQCLSIKFDNDEEENKEKFSFISAIQLIQDFQKMGLYKENAIEKNKGTLGKLDWKKTINNPNNKLFWEKSKTLPELYYKKINYNYQGKIQEIQKYCLGFVSMVIGPFYNFNYPKFIKPGPDIEMIRIIEEEIQKTNVDDKKRALIHLKNFITESNCINTNINNSQVIEFGTKKFHNIWEKIIDRKFGGISDLRKYNPKAMYLNKELKEINDAQHRIDVSRPDTIIDYKENKGLVILDAKYYKVGNLPGEYDINKQLRYAEYCAKQYFNKRKNGVIYNIFILPKFIRENKPYDIEAFATNENFYTSFLEENDIIDGRKIVAVCYVDVKKLISLPDSYWKEKLDEILNEIFRTYKVDI